MTSEAERNWEPGIKVYMLKKGEVKRKVEVQHERVIETVELEHIYAIV